jgi:ketosteroid isomerase-like protein
MNSESNKAIVRDFLATFSNGDIAGVIDRMADDGSWWVSGSIPGMSGRHSREQFSQLLKRVKDIYVTGALPITPMGMISEGDLVACEAESCAELKNGRFYKNRYHLLFRLSDGKIAEVREYMDTHHAVDIFLTP